MAIHLECLRGAHQGRQLPIRAEKPLTIKTQKSDVDAGEIAIELRDGLCVLSNRSRMICTVNGRERADAVLAAGDEVTIGKQVFRLVVDGDVDDTQKVRAVVTRGHDGRRFCSVCDRTFDADDDRRGWTDGSRRICRACLSKGVGPEHLPRPAAPPPTTADAMLAEGDLNIEDIVSGTAATASTTTAVPAATRDADAAARQAEALMRSDGDGETDRGRRSRRISASRLAQVEPAAAERTGILKRVGSVFAGGREDRKRLEAAESERAHLLQDSGRRALKANGGFGLPDQTMAVIIQGAPVTVRPGDLSAADLGEYRNARQRLEQLDAEISVLRSRLKLGADPTTSGRRSSPLLRADRIAREQRAFQTLDEIGTADLDGDAAVTARPEKSETDAHVATGGAKATEAVPPSSVKSSAAPGSSGGERRKPARRRR